MLNYDEIITTEEKRLKDVNGYEIWKIIDNKGMRNQQITYAVQDEEDMIDCFKTLKEAQEFAKTL